MLLFKWMGAQLQVVHCLGVDNVLADYVSRNVADPTEWSLDRKLGWHLIEMWDRPQIDLFPLARNTCLPLGYSWAYHPEAIAQTLFYNCGQGCLCMLFSRSCCYKTLAKIWADRAEVIVIVPTWLWRS